MSDKKIKKMNFKLKEIIKTIIFGFLIWFVPAMVATLLWDVSTNKPIIDMTWFNAVMGAVWSVNFALFAYLYFRNVRINYSKYGLVAGIIWYIMSFLLDFLVTVLILGLGLESFLPGIIVYINNFILAVMIGYLLTKKIQNDKFDK